MVGDYYIEPTNQCNLRCEMCPNRASQRPQGRMHWNVFEKAIAERPSPVVHLYFGGEPLLHPLIGDMVAHAQRKHCMTMIYTNGLAMTPELCDRFCSVPLDILGFSLDSAAFQQYTRKEGAFHLATAIANVRALRKTRGNLARPIIAVDVIQIPGVPDQFGQAKMHLADFVDEFRRKAYFHYPLLSSVPSVCQTPCSQPEGTLGVLWDGRVTPCCLDFGATGIVGDITKQSIQEILTSPERNKIRQACAAGRQNELPLCRTCHSVAAISRPYLE